MGDIVIANASHQFVQGVLRAPTWDSVRNHKNSSLPLLEQKLKYVYIPSGTPGFVRSANEKTRYGDSGAEILFVRYQEDYFTPPEKADVTNTRTCSVFVENTYKTFVRAEGRNDNG